ncbi:T-cell activation inhibitor, mitochondrial [Eurytemora carolleeae]|uniref:T-cell activation inhibitor, mitochondrial n=1 Tax=Eurytemora carolleeae TaxID=1294199 RepID=UPI000C780D8D|nr:T-cell activation inhibitor, mitochondrial [Eurytemora carolleeae]|eukprot:XP_023321080.1 T-cell activation inhibitor, mitochondrial-like [Eurytemora affinis]
MLTGVGVCVWVRSLSSHEVSNALRPFYFLVHPDLFGKHPEAQEQNEKSLKTLKNYVDFLTERKIPNPKDVTFFIKPRTQEEKDKLVLRSVSIRLNEKNIRRTVLTILKQAGLPTGYVDKISQKTQEKASAKKIVDDVSGFEERFDEEINDKKNGFGFSATDIRQPFVSWLNYNIDKEKGTGVNIQNIMCHCKYKLVNIETERLQGEICYSFQMKDIIWDCGWDTLNRRGSIEAFNCLATQHSHIQESLVGRKLVFGKRSGVSVVGDIILYSGEVRSNWLNIINNVEKSQKVLSFLPLYQRAVSQSLLDIQLVHDGTTLVEEYRTRLRKLVTTLADYKLRNNFPRSWPHDLSEFSLSVESDACSLMLTPGGVFKIPASTPGFLIVEFISVLHPSLIPVVSSDPVDSVSGSNLSTALQVYRVDEKKLIIFQLRSGILPGQVANYLEVGKNTQIIKLKGQ